MAASETVSISSPRHLIGAMLSVKPNTELGEHVGLCGAECRANCSLSANTLPSSRHSAHGSVVWCAVLMYTTAGNRSVQSPRLSEIHRLKAVALVTGCKPCYGQRPAK